MNVYLKAGLVAAAVYYFTRKTALTNVERMAEQSLEDKSTLSLDLDVKLGSAINADRGQTGSVSVSLKIDNSGAKDTGESAILSDIKVLYVPKAVYDKSGFSTLFVSVSLPDTIVPGGQVKTIESYTNYYSQMYSGYASGVRCLRIEYTLNGVEYAEEQFVEDAE